MAFTYGTITNAKGGNGQTITAYQVRLGYELQSQDIENNTSTIKLQLEVRSTNSTYKTFGYNQTTTIDGTSLAAKTFDMRSTNVWQIFGTRTITVNHNADGTYSVNKSGSFTTTATESYSLKSGNANVDVILPTIPRASTITVNDANIGSGTTININRSSRDFTTTIRYKAFDENDWSDPIVTKWNGDSYGWTVPTSFYSKIPSSQTMICYFKAETYSGNTLIGESTTQATFRATGNPYFYNISRLDINNTTISLTGDNTKMIRYASDIEVFVDATGLNSSSIVSITVNGTPISLTGDARKTGSIIIYGASTNQFVITATDSRGYTTTEVHTLSVVDYVPLTINATISRNTPVDGKINISFNGNYFNGSFGAENNTLTVQYRSRIKNGTWENWTNITSTINGNSYSGNTQLSNYIYTNQYEFQIRAIDELQTRVIEGINVSKGQPIFWWNDDGLKVTKDLTVGNIFNTDYVGISGAVSNGKVRFIPHTTYSSLNTSTDRNDFITTFLNWICDTYPNDYDTTYIGQITPNAQGTIIVHIYNNSDRHMTTGLPQYSSGLYVNLDQPFGFNTYAYNYSAYDLAKTSDVPTNNNQLINGMGFTTFDCTTGTSGIWTYEKFSNGFAICWGTYVFSSTINNSWGGLYNGSAVEPPDFPFTFTEIPTVTMTPTNSESENTGYMWILGNYGGSGGKPSTTNPGKFTPSRGSSASSSQKYAVAITAFGKWK